MQKTYGLFNHAYILQAFEDFFEKSGEICSFNLENFLKDFADGNAPPSVPVSDLNRRILRPQNEELRAHLDQQACLYFMMLYRLYGKEQVAQAVSLVTNGETLAHKAARGGLYNLLVDQMIG